ncbi:MULTISPECIES: type II toxin-antitoxin system VapC family toxin [Methylobacteriaceae]|uniref:type II toxin-antitoxin system VapC family toxin n=1 Tax=Methylobacteriaceae TaxID=119045 RepID=UPI00074F8BA3|nr:MULTISPECIES: type II toxin-antitoxin system VapC family toxin [Methylobacteriaceae]AMB44512.1 twitching motility protein PilT [Methylobacterium sp. AMS5]TFZ60620.1 type II toxin-antitoxin system VapC family toxin [Methylorubrum sp. Q1]
MFVDTSAVVAILAGEPEASAFAACIEAAERRETGPHVRLEAVINLARILGLPVAAAQEMYDAFLEAAGITVVSINDAVARRAVAAFDTYGKGRGHPAQLNFADCLSYACAATGRVPMLFKGRDFLHTDLEIAS